MRKIVTALVVFLNAGCVSLDPLIIPKSNPSPNIGLSLSDNKKSISLVLDDSIKNEFEVSHKNFGGKNRLWKMTYYRDSLQAGFKNGFRDFFRIDPPESSTDFIVEISKADFEFVPDAIDGYGNTAAVRANITFKAILKKKNGNAVKMTAATARAKKAAVFEYESGGIKMAIDNKSVESVIESMYEVIAKEFF
jgi:hypothetical protein